jgi:hypothetical protein
MTYWKQLQHVGAMVRRLLPVVAEREFQGNP